MYNEPIRIDSTIFASRLMACRKQKGISKVQVAKDLDIATSSMTYYEQGKSLPSIDKLYAIAEYFGVSMDYLCGRVDKNTQAIQTELDVAETVLALSQFDGVDLITNKETDIPELVFTLKALKDFLNNRVSYEQLKRKYANTLLNGTAEEKLFKEICFMRQNTEFFLSDVLKKSNLSIKDGSANYNIRRKRDNT